jgi:hypothetical protein
VLNASNSLQLALVYRKFINALARVQTNKKANFAVGLFTLLVNTRKTYLASSAGAAGASAAGASAAGASAAGASAAGASAAGASAAGASTAGASAGASSF